MSWLERYKRPGLTAEQFYQAEVQLKDQLMRTREFVKDRPHLHVRLYLDHHHINRKVVRADGRSWMISGTEFNPWTSNHAEFMKWRFEDGYLIVREERFAHDHGHNAFLTIVKSNRVRLIQVIEPERVLQETVNPRV